MSNAETLADVIEWQMREAERRGMEWERFYRECADVAIATRGEAPPFVPPYSLDEADRP